MAATNQEIPNRFDFQSAQARLYQHWLEQRYFHAEPDQSREPFTIVIPPPNVTGALHLGHALNNTLQDVLIRFKRMQGFNALWIPGTDHAGIATQAVVERRLKEQEGKTRHDLGRDELVRRIWQWKDEYEQRILGQLQQMGCSCDWERTRFTLDPICAKAVRYFFFDLFRKRLIYRGKRLVNWDTFLQTAVSDDEVFSKKVQGHFWHLKYPVIDPKPGEPEFVHVATTRPETMLGDTAVAVHPDPRGALEKRLNELREQLTKCTPSERATVEAEIQTIEHRIEEKLNELEKLVEMAKDGRKILLPLMNYELPIVLDEWAKPELGSGCVKITPAHDPNDYEVARRHDLPMINIMNPDGTLNGEAGPYAGLTIKEARAKIVEDLEAEGFLEKVEDREIELPHSDRSKTPIEPLLADQWFVKMDQLAQSAMDAVIDKRVAIIPERYERGYLDWLSEKRDWPVSRQLWWGHRIPVWSRPAEDAAEVNQISRDVFACQHYDDESASVQFEESSEPDPEKRKLLGLPMAVVHVCLRDEDSPLAAELEAIGFRQEEDVLDTWFSSALWPHSTLGWPDPNPDLDYFYPTSVLITSRDIITLWVARMVLAGLNNMGEVPFRRVFIHPKILDGYGETMSKSKGNGIDPLDVIDKFGADALRFAMAYLTTDTQDVRMPVQFECPHCGHHFDQTKKNRTLPRVPCPNCKKEFSTQWAQSDEDRALPRGMVLSDRFDDAAKFVNKLWNASRFAMMHLDGYTAEPIDEATLRLEDRWILSRLATVIAKTTEGLDAFRYAEVTRELYSFAWDEFCSFYIEMLKDRLADEGQRGQAQRILVAALDALLRLLHPFIPFVTEEIWQWLGKIAPERGWPTPEPAAESIMIAPWPSIDEKWQSAEIERQFSRFAAALGAVREIRSRQNLPPKKQISFSIQCSSETAELLSPMVGYFRSMAAADLEQIGPQIESPKIKATIALPDMEIFVDLAGLIDVPAELARLEKEKARLESAIAGKERQLANEKFVKNAKPEIVEKARESLQLLKEQHETIVSSLNELHSMT